MAFQHAYVLPIVVFVWFPVSFIITYVVSVCHEDILPAFAYISDTGTWSPASCIFGQLMNMGALLVMANVYIRYMQVKYVTKTLEDTRARKVNFASLICGIVACIGVSIVGNFQETNILVVHLLGAGAAFGIGVAYQMLQTWISFKLFPTIGNKKINYVRFLCSVVSALTNCGTTICGILSFLEFTGEDITKWKPEDPGYYLHISSTINEWLLVLVTLTFFLFYTWEFKSISIKQPEFSVTLSEK